MLSLLTRMLATYLWHVTGHHALQDDTEPVKCWLKWRCITVGIKVYRISKASANVNEYVG